MGDTVEFLGEVSDVPGVLARADVYVQPSFQEGLPNAVLEAMAMGLPIVATRVSGNEDVVADGDNGLLVRRAIRMRWRPRCEHWSRIRRWRSAWVDVPASSSRRVSAWRP